MHSIPDWSRALGPTLIAARIRSVPTDFLVTEDLPVDFTDDGEHDLLWIKKTGANTQWVAERLAEHAGVSARDAGYSGMKDRHAVTRQWFSVRRPGAAGTDWKGFAADGVEILEQRRHRRKLKRGAHKANAFRIALRAEHVADLHAGIADRIARIRAIGVPNYFGEQRFGRGGANLDLCRSLFAGRRMSRNKRSIALSTARSLMFNDILNLRVQAETWNKMLPGELANLDGSGSVFAVLDVDAEIERRCAEMDIHPTGSLWGQGAPTGTQAVADIENKVAATHADLCAGLEGARVDASSRPLRLRVQDLDWQIEDDALWLEFRLGRGSYATAVLREVATW